MLYDVLLKELDAMPEETTEQCIEKARAKAKARAAALRENSDDKNVQSDLDTKIVHARDTWYLYACNHTYKVVFKKLNFLILNTVMDELKQYLDDTNDNESIIINHQEKLHFYIKDNSTFITIYVDLMNTFKKYVECIEYYTEQSRT